MMMLEKTALPQVEAKKRKREEKMAAKEKKDEKLAESRLKNPNNVKELLAELNKIANIEYKKAPTHDKKGKVIPNYFYTKHTERDLDWIGDLDIVSLNEVKRAM
jgi:hypothetical protein